MGWKQLFFLLFHVFPSCWFVFSTVSKTRCAAQKFRFNVSDTIVFTREAKLKDASRNSQVENMMKKKEAGGMGVGRRSARTIREHLKISWINRNLVKRFMAFLFRRCRSDIQLWCGILARVLFFSQEAGSEPNQTWQNWVGLLKLQKDQRKSTCIIKEKYLIGGQIKEILLLRLEAWKKRVTVLDCILQELMPRQD